MDYFHSPSFIVCIECPSLQEVHSFSRLQVDWYLLSSYWLVFIPLSDSPYPIGVHLFAFPSRRCESFRDREWSQPAFGYGKYTPRCSAILHTTLLSSKRFKWCLWFGEGLAPVYLQTTGNSTMGVSSWMHSEYRSVVEDWKVNYRKLTQLYEQAFHAVEKYLM